MFMSILLSVLLTVVLNAVIRLFPGAAGRRTRRMSDWAQGARPMGSSEAAAGRVGRSPLRAVAPWQTMLLASLGLTILVNVIIRVI